MSEQITTVEERDTLPPGVVLMHGDFLYQTKGPTANGAIVVESEGMILALSDIPLPALVLYRPDRPVGPDVEQIARAIADPGAFLPRARAEAAALVYQAWLDRTSEGMKK